MHNKEENGGRTRRQVERAMAKIFNIKENKKVKSHKDKENKMGYWKKSDCKTLTTEAWKRNCSPEFSQVEYSS